MKHREISIVQQLCTGEIFTTQTILILFTHVEELMILKCRQLNPELRVKKEKFLVAILVYTISHNL